MSKKVILVILALFLLIAPAFSLSQNEAKLNILKARYKKTRNVKLRKTLEKRIIILKKRVAAEKAAYKKKLIKQGVSGSVVEKYKDYHIAAPDEIKDAVAGFAAQPQEYVKAPIVVTQAPQAAPLPQAASAPQVAEQVAPTPAEDDLFANITTNFNVDVNARQAENAPVDSFDINANFTAAKGPVYFQYTHSRVYSRPVDEFFSQAGDFQGSVNNRFAVGVNITPTFASNDEQPASSNLASNQEAVPAQAGAVVVGAAVSQ